MTRRLAVLVLTCAGLIGCRTSVEPPEPPPLAGEVVQPSVRPLHMTVRLTPAHCIRGRGRYDIRIRGTDVELSGCSSSFDFGGFIHLRAHLDQAVADELSELVRRSRFFEPWPQPTAGWMDVTHWDVEVVRGSLSHRRAFFKPPEWDEVEPYLHRLAREAEWLHQAIVHHHLDCLDTFFTPEVGAPRVLPTRLAVDALHTVIENADEPETVAHALTLISGHVSRREWIRALELATTRHAGSWRDDVLSACRAYEREYRGTIDRLRRAEREDAWWLQLPCVPLQLRDEREVLFRTHARLRELSAGSRCDPDALDTGAHTRANTVVEP